MRRTTVALRFSIVIGCASLVGWLYLAELALGDELYSLTLTYSGAEQGLLGLHGCGTEQLGGLSRRQTLLQSLQKKHTSVLNIHTGNMLDPTDPNCELIYQIALEASSAMNYEAVCLGPQDLCLPIESISALLANYSNLPFVVTNIATESGNTLPLVPYIIRKVRGESTEIQVAIVGLISKAHETLVNASNPHLTVIDEQIALSNLMDELTEKSDAVVVVFHGGRSEAEEVAKEFSWVDVLIINQDGKGVEIEDKDSLVSPLAAIRNTAIVINPTKGEAVGVLEIGIDFERRVVFKKNQQIVVSESIAPDSDLETLLQLYQKLAEGDELNDETTAVSEGAIYVTYFHKRGCQKCARASQLLHKLKAQHPQVVVEKRYAKEDQQLLEAMGKLYNVPEVKRLTTPAVFVGDQYFLDELDKTRLEATIQKYLATGVTSRLPQAQALAGEAESEIVKRFASFGALTVAGAGLLDGINPCAFATIVFFISYLSLVGRSRMEMLMAGIAFASAVFITYLLLGIGALTFLSYLNEFSIVAKTVYLLAAIVTFVLAILSLLDAYKAKQGKVKEITLQLPKPLKQRIHFVIRERTRASGVIAGALVIGFAISVLELVCTGQVYLPTITFVMGVEGMRVYALSYLILYNMMFVVPLLVVFSLVYWGTTSMQLGGILQRHLISVKLGTGVLLFGLGTWLLLSVIG